MVVWIYHSKRLLTLKYALWKATVISYLIQSLGAGDGTGPGWLLQVKCYFKFPFFLSEPFPEYQYKTSSGPITCHSWQDNGKTWPFFMEFWPIFDLVDHFGALTSLPCLAIFGPKWTIFGPSPVMNGRPQSKKKAHHHVSYVWPVCGTPNIPFWNINMVAINEKCQK